MSDMMIVINIVTWNLRHIKKPQCSRTDTKTNTRFRVRVGVGVRNRHLELIQDLTLTRLAKNTI